MTNTTLETINAVLEELQNASAVSEPQVKNWALNQSLDDINSKTLHAISSVLVERITEAGGVIDPSIERLRDQLQSALDRTDEGLENGKLDYSTSFGMVLNVLTDKAGLNFAELTTEINDVQARMMRSDASIVINDIIEQKLLEVSTIPAAPITEFEQVKEEPAMLENRLFELQTSALNNEKNALALQFENVLTGASNLAVQDMDALIPSVMDAIKQNNPDTVLTIEDVKAVFTPVKADSLEGFKAEYQYQRDFDTSSMDIANSKPLDPALKTDIVDALESLKRDDRRSIGNLHEPLGIRSDEYDVNTARITNQAADSAIATLDRYDVVAEKLTHSIEKYAHPDKLPANEVSDIELMQKGLDFPDNEKFSGNGRG